MSLPNQFRSRLLSPEVLGFLLLAALHLALAAPMRGPMLFGDEAAYLGIARFLAGDAPYPLLGSPAIGPLVPFYHFGYPLLLAPATWLSDDPFVAYRTALVLSSFLLAALFPLLSSFARRVLGLAPSDAVLAGMAASLYPAFLLQSNLTWAESLLAPLIAGILLAFHRLAERPGPGTACGLALGTVAAYAVHARTLALVPLTVLALGLLWKKGRLRPGAALAALLVTLVGFAAVRAVNGLVAAALWTDATRRWSVADAAAPLLQPKNLWSALLSLSGQIWYLSIASAGLFPLGVWVLARLALRRRNETESPARRLTAGFALAAGAGLLLTSALFLIDPVRADVAIYGRYAESFLGPFLVAGLAGFSAKGARRRFLAAAALPCLLVVVLLAGRGGAVFQQIYNHLNILGIVPLILLLGGVRMLRITAAGVAVILALCAAGSFRPRAAAALAGSLFLAGALYTYSHWILGANRMGNQATSLPRAVEALHAREVAYDDAAFTMRGFFGYQFWLDDVRFSFFDGSRERPPQELVISSKSFGRSHPGARMIFPERFSEPALWVMPGPLQQRLEREGRLTLPDPLAPLPDAACRSAVISIETDRLVLEPGEARKLQIRIEHRGHGAVWVPNDSLGSPLGTVRLGARWFQKGESSPVEEGGQRGDLPHALLPGDAADAEITIEARGVGGAPLATGSYVVEIGPVQEGVRWFQDAGDPPLRLPVEVRR